MARSPRTSRRSIAARRAGLSSRAQAEQYGGPPSAKSPNRSDFAAVRRQTGVGRFDRRLDQGLAVARRDVRGDRLGRVGEKGRQIVGALGGDAGQSGLSGDRPGVSAFAFDDKDVAHPLGAQLVLREYVPNILDRRAVAGQIGGKITANEI